MDIKFLVFSPFSPHLDSTLTSALVDPLFSRALVFVVSFVVVVDTHSEPILYP